MVYNSNNYADYSDRIRYLKSNGESLLQEIESLKANMNRRKQQNQQPLENELSRLNTITIKSLQMQAEINVCQFFQMINEYYDFNHYYYKQMCLKYYFDLLKDFNLKTKRLINDNDNDNDVDFSILKL